MKAEDYNEEPVTACTGCKSLYLKDDEHGNTICMRCGSVNAVVVYSDIENYKSRVKDIWDTV